MTRALKPRKITANLSSTPLRSLDPMPPIMRKICRLSTKDLMSIWRNCIIETTKPNGRPIAVEMLKRIEVEWKKRRISPVSAHRLYYDQPEKHWQSDSFLADLGYRVGRKGEERRVRWAMLSRIYYGELPPILSPEAMDRWGEPESETRLRKIVETIAGFIAARRGNKRADYAFAIKSWADDLEFLRLNFYRGRYFFSWPKSDPEMD